MEGRKTGGRKKGSLNKRDQGASGRCFGEARDGERWRPPRGRAGTSNWSSIAVPRRW